MLPTPAQITARRSAFRQLHASGCFAIPNPWDAGSARYLAQLGFKALASTSSGHAWSQGHADGGMPLPAVLDYLRSLVAATDLPVNADFEHGFADDAAGVARNVALAVDTGVAGLSIEDSTGRPDAPLLPLDEAVQRVRAARAAIDASGQDVLLVEGRLQRRSTMPGGSESDLLVEIFGVRHAGVVRSHQGRDIDKILGGGQLSGAR